MQENRYAEVCRTTTGKIHSRPDGKGGGISCGSFSIAKIKTANGKDAVDFTTKCFLHKGFGGFVSNFLKVRDKGVVKSKLEKMGELLLKSHKVRNL